MMLWVTIGWAVVLVLSVSFKRTGNELEQKLHTSYRPVIFYAVIFIAGFLMRNHPQTYPDYVWQGLFTVAFLYEGTYCLRNFAHCREAHCIVTGTGWTIVGVLSLLSTTRLFTFGDWGYYWLGFLLVYIAGMTFQAIYYSKYHTTQLSAGK